MTLHKYLRILFVPLLFMSAHSALRLLLRSGVRLPKLVSFASIQAAVIGVTPGSTIKVCPGTYYEQVTISQPLTLQGVVSGNAARAVIAVPALAQGLQPNVTSAVTGVWTYIAQFAAQVLVQAPGPVNITDITVDGTGANLGVRPRWSGWPEFFMPLDRQEP